MKIAERGGELVPGSTARLRKRRRRPTPECAAEMCDVPQSYSQSRVAIAFASRVCHHPGMANEKSKAPPEGKFAETMRKSREKRASMTEQSQQRAQAQEESLLLEEAKRADHTFARVRDSES